MYLILFQFHRQFPGPPDVSDSEIALLVQKYRDPDRPGLLNYLNLHHDLVAIQQHVAAQKELPSVGSQKNMDQVPIIVSLDKILYAWNLSFLGGWGGVRWGWGVGLTIIVFLIKIYII